jgi:hypothetical protein
MRRFVVAAIVVIGFSTCIAAPASGAPLAKLEAHVTGVTTGVSSFTACPNGDLRSDMTGTYVTLDGRTGSYHIDVCLAFGGIVFTITSGAFTITTPKGATLTGVVTGVGNADGHRRHPAVQACVGHDRVGLVRRVIQRRHVQRLLRAAVGARRRDAAPLSPQITPGNAPSGRSADHESDRFRCAGPRSVTAMGADRIAVPRC